MKVKSQSEVAQSCLTLSDPMDCSLSGSSVHGIFQARVLEWVAIAFSVTNLDSILKSRDITDKGPSSQSYGFSSSHVWIWEVDHKESWAPRNWCFWTVGLEKTLESLLNCKEIKAVNPRGNQSWIFIRRTDAEVETPIFWPPDAKSRLIGKDPDSGKNWGQEEKGVTEGEMVGWYHQFSGHEFEQTLEDSEGQGSLECCSPRGLQELDMT